MTYTLRTLRKNPAYAITAILTLALGIGANTAIFSVVRAVLLKPLDYHDPERLVRVTGGATVIRYDLLRATAHSYTELGAYTVGLENMTLSGGPGPEAVKGARVSANFLHILGIEPALGRSFLPGEDRPGGPPVAMISSELWNRRFHSDSRIAGKTVALDAASYTIIGVLPAGFQFPFPAVDVWVTRPYEWSIIQGPSRALSPVLTVFGRLRPAATLEQATAELDVINRQYAAAHPAMLDSKPGPPARVKLIKDTLVSQVSSLLWMLFGAVGFVLLIACANVASLLLARAASRSREFALRSALGATRGHLIRQLLSESAALAIAGGACGLWLAHFILRAILSATAINLPRAGEIHLDSTVLGFAALLSILTGALFGFAPAFSASRPDVAQVLRAGGATSNQSGRARWFTPRSLLVIGQVALSIVLLIGATLLMESLARVRGVDPGFQPAHTLTVQIALPTTRYDTAPKRTAFFEELVRRMDSLPGVDSAAVTMTLPMTGWAGSPVQVPGQAPSRLNQRPIAIVQTITPAFFRTLRIPLRRGREFTAHDTAGSTGVVIITESLARRFWPAGVDPVGQRLQVGVNPQPLEIVGIVADIRQSGLEEDARPGVYRALAQAPPSSAMLAIRTNGDPLLLANAVRDQVHSLDPDQSVTQIRTLEAVVEESEGQRFLVTTLLGSFAAAALLLAMVGIYGVIAYSVTQRTRELGIRRALGARKSDILLLVLRQSLGLALSGVIIGIAAALALTRVMEGLLFQISPTDPATFVSIALVLVLVALAAAWIPASRATRVDPTTALRA